MSRVAAVSALVAVLALSATTKAQTWSASQFKSFITFGDSYTDESRLGYFINNNGSAPPPGTLLPESYSAASGGRAWARYVVQYTGETTADGAWDPSLTLYNYAVSGAVCSNEITPRVLDAIHANFPDIDGYELGAFLADKESNRNGTDEPYFTPALTATNSVYSFWIGTNDLGVWAFLTDSQVLGKVLTDYTDCVFAQIDRLYASGGRYFVLMNLAPLELSPLYANETAGGIGDNAFWPNKPDNLTAIAEQMREYTRTVNAIYQYQTPFEALVAGRYPGANFALYDVHSLIMDMYTNPNAYFNGSLPANVTGYDRHCDVNGSNCSESDSPDSFLWFDQLHPSEQADRIIAEHFVDILNGNSTYGAYYTGSGESNSTQVSRNG